MNENKYASAWTSKGDKIYIEKLTRYSEPVYIKELLLQSDTLRGNGVDSYGRDIGEIIFIKQN